MDFARFIQIYIVQGLFALFFLYMAYLVLKREKKKINLYLSSFYLSVTIGGVLNMIYTNIFDPTIVFIMHFMTYYLFYFSMVFILIFILILIKPTKQINFKLQILIIIISSLLILGLFFVPDGIIINGSTHWKPNWSWFFFSLLCYSVYYIHNFSNYLLFL